MASAASRVASPELGMSMERSAPVTQRAVWLIVGSILVTLIAVNVAVQLLEPTLLNAARFDQEYTAAHLVEYLQGPTPNVVFMGSSRVLASFHQGVMASEIESLTGRGVTVRNLAVSSGTIELSYLILK